MQELFKFFKNLVDSIESKENTGLPGSSISAVERVLDVTAPDDGNKVRIFRSSGSEVQSIGNKK